MLVEEVVTYLKRYGADEVEDLTVIEEDVEFLLPKELITIESCEQVCGSASPIGLLSPSPNVVVGFQAIHYLRYFSLISLHCLCYKTGP